MLRNFIAVLVMIAAPYVAAAVEVQTTSVARGVEAWYAADDTLPIVHIVLSFEGAGTASDPAGKHGLAQLAATMLLEGAGSYDALAFQEALESHAISLDSAVSQDRVTLSIHTLKEHAPLAVKLARLALTKPRLEASDLARVKQAQQAALQRASEDAAYRASRQFAERAFADHPYANPSLGDAEGIDAVSVEDIRQFANTYLTSGNLKIAAAGDVDDDAIEAWLVPIVEALPRNDTGAVAVATTAVREQGIFNDDSLNVPQTSVLFGAPGIRRKDPEFYAAYLLMQIIGGDGLNSRLMREVRQKNGLAYSASAGLDEYRGAVLLSGALSTKNGTRDEAIAEVKKVFEDVYLNGVSTQECEDAKTYVKGNFPLQLDNTKQLAQMLLSMQIFDLGKDYIAKRESYFDAVSCSDINRSGKALLDPSRLLFVSVGGGAKQDKAP